MSRRKRRILFYLFNVFKWLQRTKKKKITKELYCARMMTLYVPGIDNNRKKWELHRLLVVIKKRNYFRKSFRYFGVKKRKNSLYTRLFDASESSFVSSNSNKLNFLKWIWNFSFFSFAWAPGQVACNQYTLYRMSRERSIEWTNNFIRATQINNVFSHTTQALLVRTIFHSLKKAGTFK